MRNAKLHSGQKTQKTLSISNSGVNVQSVDKDASQVESVKEFSGVPLFNGLDFLVWCMRMQVYLSSLGYDVWMSVENGYSNSTTHSSMHL